MTGGGGSRFEVFTILVDQRDDNHDLHSEEVCEPILIARHEMVAFKACDRYAPVNPRLWNPLFACSCSDELIERGVIAFPDVDPAPGHALHRQLSSERIRIDG